MSSPAAMQTSRSVIMGAAGHIDHGKTALVRALTGTDTDRLPEEKKRGITIDLGFAAMAVRGESGIALQVSLIDVPGHHAFVRNMLAGAGGIEAVLLVIAADEGVMAQTREHVDICSLLGLERGVVALTKCDAVDAERLDAVTRSVRSWLAGTFLRDAEVIPVSAFSGHGIERLRRELAHVASRIPERSRDYVPRLPPDRSFAKRGFGTVVTGTLQSGSVRTGTTLTLLPGEERVRVRGIQVRGKAVDQVEAAERVALNLSGVEHREIRRGQMLVPEGTLSATQLIDAEVTLLEHAGTLRHRAIVRVHAFAGDVAATVLLYGLETTGADKKIMVRLQLDAPQVLVPGDRFVLRQPSPPATIGGGRVLETTMPRRQRKADALRWLIQMRDADHRQQLLLRVSRQGTSGIATERLVRETGLTSEAVRRITGEFLHDGMVVSAGGENGPFLSGAAVLQAQGALLRAVTGAKRPSIARAELRSRSGLNGDVFAFALNQLLKEGKLTGTEHLSLPEFSQIPEEERARLESVEREYRAAGVAPPLVADVAQRLKLGERQLRGTITLLLRGKRLLRLGSDDLFIHNEAVRDLAKRLQTHRGEEFDVARFKAFTGLTRKHAIPLLELLDRGHITRLRPGSAGTRTIV